MAATRHSSGRSNPDKQLAELEARLASDPEWHGGRYYGKAACKTVLTDIRVETLKRYGIETALAPRFPDPAAREAAIRDQDRLLVKPTFPRWTAHPPTLASIVSRIGRGV